MHKAEFKQRIFCNLPWLRQLALRWRKIPIVCCVPLWIGFFSIVAERRCDSKQFRCCCNVYPYQNIFERDPWNGMSDILATFTYLSYPLSQTVHTNNIVTALYPRSAKLKRRKMSQNELTDVPHQSIHIEILEDTVIEHSFILRSSKNQFKNQSKGEKNRENSDLGSTSNKFTVSRDVKLYFHTLS